MRQSGLLVTTSLLSTLVLALPAAAQESWGRLGFLIGAWSGKGRGEPGQGVGSFSFAPDLQGGILVRRAHSEYPAAGGRPATVHDDLLVIYGQDTLNAVYFDNEGHVIHYDVGVNPARDIVTFLSVDPPPSPAFRLTYTRLPDDRVEVVFEIANDDQRSDFRTYVRGIVSRNTANGGTGGPH